MDDEYFYRLAKKLLKRTEEFSLTLLGKVRDTAKRLIRDPRANVNLSDEERAILSLWQNYNQDAKAWVDDTMPKAYKKGLVNLKGEQMVAGSFSSQPLFGDIFTGQISDRAKELLKDNAEHWNMYGVFQEAAYGDFDDMRLPVVRSATDKLRELTVEASTDAYLNADALTRRDLTQDLMTRFADEGITGVRYSDGRTMNIQSYSELVARSQTGNASRQATINRAQEYGRDLILISSHYPVSPLCEPHQGKVYSISGDSNNYPPFSQTNPGSELFHGNCKHSQSIYTPGQKIPEAREKVSKPENKRRYKAQQTQRYNERQIRKWKQREATAVDPKAQQKARSKISEWQGKQRDLLEDNDYLRRRYSRESV